MQQHYEINDDSAICNSTRFPIVVLKSFIIVFSSTFRALTKSETSGIIIKEKYRRATVPSVSGSETVQT